MTEGSVELRVPAARIVFSDEDRAEILAMVDTALRTGALTLGRYTRELEVEFAARHGSEHAVAVSSGTSALEIALRCLGATGGEVVVPANTFFATAAAVLHAGARPRFADVDVATFAMSVSTIEEAIGFETRGVVLVHIGGLVTPDVEAIRDLCSDRGLFLLEDAAHAHGASYAGRSVGTFGRAAGFSFYPTKVITSGEGGMLLTGDAALADEARIYRDQGKASFVGGAHVRLGAAWRMSELHAAVGLVHLRHLDEFIRVRQGIASVYDEALRLLDGIAPLPRPDACRSNLYKYVALLQPDIDRSALKQRLRDEHGIQLSGEVYATPLHLEPVFEPYRDRKLPVAEDVAARHVCLPVHSDMTQEEAAYVVDGLQAVLAGTGEVAGALR